MSVNIRFCYEMNWVDGDKVKYKGYPCRILLVIYVLDFSSLLLRSSLWFNSFKDCSLKVQKGLKKKDAFQPENNGGNK